MAHERGQCRLIDMSCGRRGSARVTCGALPRQHPIVDQRIARTGVEGQQSTTRCPGVGLRADPGNVGDAADVQDGQRPRQMSRKSGVEDRDEWGAFAAGRDVGAAKIADHVDLCPLREQLAIADLPGKALARAVNQGLAVKADDVDARRGQPGLLQQCADRGSVRERHVALNRLDRLAAAQGAPQSFAQAR